MEGDNDSKLGLWAIKLRLQTGLNGMTGPDGHFLNITTNCILSLEIEFWSDRYAGESHGVQERVQSRENWEGGLGGTETFVSNKYVGVDVANISSRVTWYCGGSS